ncbi:hypothetical protein [Yersinia phage fHe-Yen9-04]|uniref:Uncharacterized protein n=2 Tax=Eneladusvirus Yen904 TaxID=2560849 RepID=A0A2C9CXR6_9CAUD|nr:hypothetical protein FDJ41_gp350 [Yersinia phage fHe-Yen9-04]SOK58627.1 hypothetical protein [Yersinia phage fHe-Yen9-04]SOK59159.1 hypothetical protein [Yersinia phage fHe-Yen9-03]VUE36396.1 hypothetical protein [Yersinia phage fHe-Yen9-04]
MGLDITAYQNIKIIDSPDLDDNDEIIGLSYDEYFNVYNYTYFKEHFKDLEVNGYYEFEDSFNFRAGSYGGYNSWRNELAFIVCKLNNLSSTLPSDTKNLYSNIIWNLPENNNIPLYKFINFSDCEGIIGTEYCNIIYKELLSIETEFKSHNYMFDDAYNHNNKLFDNWLLAFKMGSENGCVSFH